MSFAVWHGRCRKVAFDVPLPRTAVFDASHSSRAPLTAEYNGYSFTTDVDLVLRHLSDFVGLSACDDDHIEVVVGLD
jgi:hypothetical protein